MPNRSKKQKKGRKRSRPCIVCGIYAEDNPSVSFFSWPHRDDAELFSKFCRSMNVSEAEVPKFGSRRPVICSLHFHKNQLIHGNDKVKLIRKGAVPEKFPRIPKDDSPQLQGKLSDDSAIIEEPEGTPKKNVITLQKETFPNISSYEDDSQKHQPKCVISKDGIESDESARKKRKKMHIFTANALSSIPSSSGAISFADFASSLSTSVLKLSNSAVFAALGERKMIQIILTQPPELAPTVKLSSTPQNYLLLNHEENSSLPDMGSLCLILKIHYLSSGPDFCFTKMYWVYLKDVWKFVYKDSIEKSEGSDHSVAVTEKLTETVAEWEKLSGGFHTFCSSLMKNVEKRAVDGGAVSILNENINLLFHVDALAYPAFWACIRLDSYTVKYRFGPPRCKSWKPQDEDKDPNVIVISGDFWASTSSVETRLLATEKSFALWACDGKRKVATEMEMIEMKLASQNDQKKFGNISSPQQGYSIAELPVLYLPRVAITISQLTVRILREEYRYPGLVHVHRKQGTEILMESREGSPLKDSAYFNLEIAVEKKAVEVFCVRQERCLLSSPSLPPTWKVTCKKRSLGYVYYTTLEALAKKVAEVAKSEFSKQCTVSRNVRQFWDRLVALSKGNWYSYPGISGNVRIINDYLRIEMMGSNKKSTLRLDLMVCAPDEYPKGCVVTITTFDPSRLHGSVEYQTVMEEFTKVEIHSVWKKFVFHMRKICIQQISWKTCEWFKMLKSLAEENRFWLSANQTSEGSILISVALTKNMSNKFVKAYYEKSVKNNRKKFFPIKPPSEILKSCRANAMYVGAWFHFRLLDTAPRCCQGTVFVSRIGIFDEEKDKQWETKQFSYKTRPALNLSCWFEQFLVKNCVIPASTGCSRTSTVSEDHPEKDGPSAISGGHEQGKSNSGDEFGPSVISDEEKSISGHEGMRAEDFLFQNSDGDSFQEAAVKEETDTVDEGDLKFNFHSSTPDLKEVKVEGS